MIKGPTLGRQIICKHYCFLYMFLHFTNFKSCAIVEIANVVQKVSEEIWGGQGSMLVTNNGSTQVIVFALVTINGLIYESSHICQQRNGYQENVTHM